MKFMRKIVLVLLLVFVVSACSNDTSKDSKVKIGIVQFVQHPSLDTINDAIMSQLKEDGYEDGKNATIYYENGQADISNLNTIITKFKDKKVDVIIAIATPAAQAALNVASDIPVVFAAVSDPIAAGLVDSLEKPDKNVTGTSDEIQVDLIIDLGLEMYPNTKTVGYLYNASEANSKSNLDKLKTYAKDHNLTIIEASISSSADINTVLEGLVNKVDIIFTPNDNTIASAMPLVSDIALKYNKPLFVGADSMVIDGGLATVGIDYEQLGFTSAKMAIQILEGSKVSDIPVKVFKDDLNIYFNQTTATKIGFTDLKKLQDNHDSLIIIE
ncbi:MAG: ABC transporter substrate-binding protein [Bacilli bacterium]